MLHSKESLREEKGLPAISVGKSIVVVVAFPPPSGAAWGPSLPVPLRVHHFHSPFPLLLSRPDVHSQREKRRSSSVGGGRPGKSTLHKNGRRQCDPICDALAAAHRA